MAVTETDENEHHKGDRRAGRGGDPGARLVDGVMLDAPTNRRLPLLAARYLGRNLDTSIGVRRHLVVVPMEQLKLLFR